MELGSGIRGLEPPVDGDPRRVFLHRGPDFPPQRVFVGEPLPQAGTDQYAELDFGQVQPTAMLGGVVELQPFGNPPRLGCREGLVQRRQVSPGECSGCPGPPGPPESPGRLHPPASASAGRILHRAPFGHRHVAPTGQRLAGQEPVAGSLSPVLVVLPLGQSRLGRQRGPGVGQQLG